MILARLQYAVLAEFAKVDAGGLLTIVGAGFDRVMAGSLPSHQPIALALRSLLAEDEPEASVVLTLRPPEGLAFRFATALRPAEDARFHQGYVGVATAINLTVPLMVPGVYHLSVAVNDEEQQELSFEVEVSGPAQQGGA